MKAVQMNFVLNILWLPCAIHVFASPSLPFQELEDRDEFPLALNHKLSFSNYDSDTYQAANVEAGYEETQPGAKLRDLYSSDENQGVFKRNPDDRQRHYGHYYQVNRSENEESHNENGMTTRIFRTYGRGKAEVRRNGDSVTVPNSISRKNTNKNKNESKMRKKAGKCTECPTDQTVVATKGHTHVILPEPCHSNNSWIPFPGPKPGSKIQEGVHIVRGTLASNRKYCQYQYQVIVRRCEPLKIEEDTTTMKCSANDAWGSKCDFSCLDGREPLGPTELECTDNLTWSNAVPLCKRKTDCTTPKVKSNSKIWCQTANMTHVQGDFIPNGSTCRFKKNGIEVSINCKDGIWRKSRRTKGNLQNRNKSKYEQERNEDVCKSNPCKNGGTCLKSDTNKDTPVCLCRPMTHGTYCELRQCDLNICQNRGLCFIQNDQRICYCLPEYGGDRCQHHTAHYTRQ